MCAQVRSAVCSVNFSEVQRKWKEELDQELERKRGIVLMLFNFLFRASYVDMTN